MYRLRGHLPKLTHNSRDDVPKSENLRTHFPSAHHHDLRDILPVSIIVLEIIFLVIIMIQELLVIIIVLEIIFLVVVIVQEIILLVIIMI